MEPTVLIYGVEGASAKRLRELIAKKGVRARAVRAEEYAESVGAMCRVLKKTGAAPTGAEMSPMLVFCGCAPRQLDMLLAEIKTACLCPDALRAVMTGTNAVWSGERLCAELERERAGMEGKK